MLMNHGRTRSAHDAASASACGARSAMARRPSSGRGDRLGNLGKFLTRKSIVWQPRLTSRDPARGAPRNRRARPARFLRGDNKPRSRIEHRTSIRRADDAEHLAPGKFRWIRTQLLSELRFHLGRQAEVLAARVIGTNLVI